MWSRWANGKIGGREEGSPYLVMEHLKGTTLHEIIRKTGDLPTEKALAILGQIADALDYAHEQGVLHRDLKPTNIFVSDEGGERLRVKMLDFGVAKLLPQEESLLLDEAEETPDKPLAGDAGRTETRPIRSGHGLPSSLASSELFKRGTLTGTPTFMAPEIARQERGTSINK